jgi:hypothetical protein
MEICNNHSDEIVYNSRNCPLCEAENTISKLEDTVTELKDEKTNLQEEIADLNILVNDLRKINRLKEILEETDHS